MKGDKISFMRLVLFFDLPVETSIQRKAYRTFVKYLTSEGYIRVQYSVYAKLCINSNSAETAAKHVSIEAPADGDIRYLIITETQYQKITNVNDTYSLQEKITTTDRTIMIGDMNDKNEDG